MCVIGRREMKESLELLILALGDLLVHHDGASLHEHKYRYIFIRMCAISEHNVLLSMKSLYPRKCKH